MTSESKGCSWSLEVSPSLRPSRKVMKVSVARRTDEVEGWKEDGADGLDWEW